MIDTVFTKPKDGIGVEGVACKITTDEGQFIIVAPNIALLHRIALQLMPKFVLDDSKCKPVKVMQNQNTP